MRRLIKRVLLSNIVSFSQSLFNSFKTRVLGDSGVVEADSCAVTTLSNLDARNLLQSATFVLAPSGYKSGVIYSEVPSNGNGDLTVTRATSATRVNSLSVIETVASGVPQLDYSLGGCPNFLFEPQRRNWIINSNMVGASSSPSTMPTGWAFSPTDATTCSVVGVGTTTDGYNYVDFRFLVSNAASTYFNIILQNSISVYTQLVNGDQAYISSYFAIVGGSFSGITNIKFNTSLITSGNGFIKNIQSASFKSNITSTPSIQGYAMTANDVNTAKSQSSILFEYPVNTSFDFTLRIYGAMIETGAGSPIVTSYRTSFIPTSGTSTTRNATVITRSNIYTNGLISASGFTWLFEIKNNLSIKGDQTDNTKFYGMFIGNSSTAPTSAICIYNDNTTALLKLGTISGTVTTPRYTTAAASIKVVITYDGTTLNAWVNGTKQISAISFSATLSAFEHLVAVNTDVPKYIAQIALWNTILPDSHCASITS